MTPQKAKKQVAAFAQALVNAMLGDDELPVLDTFFSVEDRKHLAKRYPALDNTLEGLADELEDFDEAWNQVHYYLEVAGTLADGHLAADKLAQQQAELAPVVPGLPEAPLDTTVESGSVKDE